MKSWILATVLAGGMAFAQATPADAQMIVSFGRSATSPNVTIGQPAYGGGYYGQPAYNNGYYAQPANNGGYYAQPGYSNNGYVAQPAYRSGYYGQPVASNNPFRQPVYVAPRYAAPTYAQPYPPTSTYNSGYQGYAPAPGYYPGTAYPGTGYGNPGVNLNVPYLGPVNAR